MESPIHNKATKIEVFQRVSLIKKLILQCKDRAEILQYASNKWSLTERQVYTYIAKARREIQKEYSRRDAITLTWHLKARQNIIDKATELNEPRVALAAMRDIAELQGLYVDKHEHSGKVEISYPAEFKEDGGHD